MGLLLIDKAADFSALGLGHAGLYTTVVSGLNALFETRRSSSKAANNSAPDKVGGSIIGSPTLLPASVQGDNANGVDFGPSAAPLGEQTIAFILKHSQLADVPSATTIGHLALSGAGVGYVLDFTFSGFNRITFGATMHVDPAYTGVGTTTKSAYVQLPADDRFDLYIGTLEDLVSLKIEQPRLGLMSETLTPTGYWFPPGGNYSRWKTSTGANKAFELAMFANWNRVLTAQEKTTFYAEMQAQFGLLGVDI